MKKRFLLGLGLLVSANGWSGPPITEPVDANVVNTPDVRVVNTPGVNVNNFPATQPVSGSVAIQGDVTIADPIGVDVLTMPSDPIRFTESPVVLTALQEPNYLYVSTGGTYETAYKDAAVPTNALLRSLSVNLSKLKYAEDNPGSSCRLIVLATDHGGFTLSLTELVVGYSTGMLSDAKSTEVLFPQPIRWDDADAVLRVLVQGSGCAAAVMPLVDLNGSGP